VLEARFEARVRTIFAATGVVQIPWFPAPRRFSQRERRDRLALGISQVAEE
jgi:hypothetical protein